MRVVLVALLGLVAVALAQTVCVKYGGTDQQTLMETAINGVVGRVVADPILLPWFNGQNNRANINFTDPAQSAQLSNLGAKLISFFGVALGCDQAPFKTGGKYAPGTTGVSTNMTNIHQQGAGHFAKAVTKAAYEAFNIHIIDELRFLGVSNADLYAVSQVLDTFRGPRLHPTVPDNAVCQDADCNTSPFTVQADDTTNANYFSPSYITIPSGGSVQFVNAGARSHTATQGTYTPNGACLAAAGGFNSQITPGNSYTTPAITASTKFFCNFHCANLADTIQMGGMINVVTSITASTKFFCNFHCANLADTIQMGGMINVVTPSTTSTSSNSASLALAFAAIVAALLALLM